MKDRATIVCHQLGKLLLVTRERSRWALPGGTIRRGETPQQAACRELEEETGLTVDCLQYLFLFGGLNKRHHVFFADLPDDAVPRAQNEITRCHWFGWKQIGNLAASIPTRKIVELVFDRSKGVASGGSTT